MATIIEFSPPTSQSPGLAVQALERHFWRDQVPADIAAGNQWIVWKRHLGKRRRPQLPTALCRANQSPLRWGMADELLTPLAAELLAQADPLEKKPGPKSKSRFDAASAVQIVSVWLQGTSTLPQSAGFAVECLAVAHLLPWIAESATENVWWQVLDHLWQVTQSAADWAIDAELPPEEGLAQQLLVGELPLTLAYLLPEMRPVFKLRETAREALSEGLVELTNGRGMVRGPCLSVFRPLLACWTRCQAMGQSLKKDCYNSEAQEQYAWAVAQSLCLSSSDGRCLLGQPNDAPWEPDFLATALRVGGDRSDVSAANAILGKKLTQLITGKPNDRFSETSDHCDWAGVAIMRTDWERGAPALAIDFASPDLRLEVWAGTKRLISGAWDWETTVDGKRLEAVGAWEDSCWFSDDDVDYLELSIELAGGARLERQILLARDEWFLLLADNIHGAGPGNLGHRMRLPLDAAVSFVPEEETREGLLTAGKPIARVLPLALAEWRIDPRFGDLAAAEGRLQLEQQRPGRNLACPLLIDLRRTRLSKQCTWRQLTVAEALEIQPHDVAVGYRAQCGKQQWLIYRSLGERANRTLLGQNLSSECLVARFLPSSGEIDELLEIEG